VPIKDIPLDVIELKEDSGGARTFTAYASTFGNVDAVGDIVEKGAFRQSLKERSFRPLLWQHDMRTPIGIEKSLREDGHGLLGTWELLSGGPADYAYEALKKGAVRAMSIGYRVKRIELAEEEDTRLLKEIDLLENSVVSLPANDHALVQTVKEFFGGTDLDYERMADAIVHALQGKAEWDASYINDLPDSAFALILPGGDKDSEGKTTPRGLRKLPHHSADGGIDQAHLNNALSRAPQMSGVSDAQKAAAVSHLQAHKRGSGKDDHPHLDLRSLDALSFTELCQLLKHCADAFGESTRNLLAVVRDERLTDSKQRELSALLGTFPALDAVRSDAERLLQSAKTDPEPAEDEGTEGEGESQPPRDDLDAKGAMDLGLELRRRKLRLAGVL
jgi:HK97 family phage prohead protease